MAEGGRILAEGAGIVAKIAEKQFGKKAEQVVAKDVVKDASGDVGRDAARPSPVPAPTEPYNRRLHYGKTPTAADRRTAGVASDEVLDHDPPLVQRYYEGDPTIGEEPGHTMSDEERRASGSDRSRMTPQPRPESDQQGGQMAAYSRQKKEFGL